MNDALRRHFAITVSDKEFRLMEIVYRKGPCTSEEIHAYQTEGLELLEVMRILHDLMDRGLLEGMMINKQRLYRPKANYTNFRSRLIKTESL
jgi:predicted transcriptional regulator